MDKVEVINYGIHWDPDKIAWLEQGRAGVNVYGLHSRSPFVVRLAHGGRHCNHQINLAAPIPNDRHWELFMQLQGDPLVRAMMPFPKPDAGLYYLEDRDRLTDFLVMLSRMSSPIGSVVAPFWNYDTPTIIKMLGESNVQPLALYGAKVSDIAAVRELATPAAHRPRKLIITGIKDIVLPTLIRRIDTELTTEKYDFNELNAMPWEVLGATAIKKWMRREWAGEKTSIIRPEHPARPNEPGRGDGSERSGGAVAGPS